MSRLLARLRDEEDGMTLVELLTAMLIGMVILFATFFLLDSTVKSQKRTEQRMQSVTRGRAAIEDLTRQLRAQVCLGPGAPPVVEALPNSITFYTAVNAPTGGDIDYERRTLTWTATSGGLGRVTEQVFRPTATSPRAPNIAWQTTVSRSRTVLNDVALDPAAGGAFFRYYRYNADATLQPLTAPVTGADDLRHIVMVDVAFRAFPNGSTDAKLATDLRGQAYVRTADPTTPLESPRCL